MKDLFELCLAVTAVLVIIPFYKVLYQALIDGIKMTRKRELTLLGSLFAAVIVCLASKKLGYTSPVWLVFPLQAFICLLVYYYSQVRDYLEKNIYGGGGNYWTVCFSVIYLFLLMAVDILLDGKGAGGFLMPLFFVLISIAFRAAYLLRQR